MPRFMSPMIRRRPVTDKLDEESRAVGPNAILPTNQESAQSSIEQNDEPEQPSDIRISEGGFRQIRDESLVLLSQGISHRIELSEDGPFQIFVEPEKRRAAQFQIRLYHRENPPRNENPPLPLKLTLQPLWVLAVPVACTLLDFSDIAIQMHNAGVADAAKILRGEWWRTITAMTLHGDSRHLASNLVSGFLALSLLHYRIPLAKLVPFLAVASAVANFFVALTVQTNFRSIGFSGFVFATIGCLAVIEFPYNVPETGSMRFTQSCTPGNCVMSRPASTNT